MNLNLPGMAVANIVRAELLTDDETAYQFDTAQQAVIEPVISPGVERELRVQNTVLAQHITRDIVKGYNIRLRDALFVPGVFALIDGGKSETDETGGLIRYEGPAAGQAPTQRTFTLRLYAEEKDAGGITSGYLLFAFPRCAGSPAGGTLCDGGFFAPEYRLRSRPARGESAITVDYLKTLPPAGYTV